MSSFSEEQDDLLSIFLCGLDPDVFTKNKKVSFQLSGTFKNILKSGPEEVFKSMDT
jgi:hypothetical protein